MTEPYKGTDPAEILTADQVKGERFRREADEWISANGEAWQYMVDSARLSATHHRRFGVKSLCEHVRWHMFAKGNTEFKLNNNHSAAFARRLIRDVPECEPFLNTRHSVLDA